MDRFPLTEIPAATRERLKQLGGRPLNLYRILGNQPAMLDAWIGFAYGLRLDAKTPRALRELMILRTAQLAQSGYEWHQHRWMAKDAGVDELKVAELAMWRQSDRFDTAERAALALTEAIVAGTVPDEVHAQAARCFTDPELIELVLTAAYYTMVPRVLDAIGVTTEGEAQG